MRAKDISNLDLEKTVQYKIQLQKQKANYGLEMAYSTFGRISSLLSGSEQTREKGRKGRMSEER